MGAVGKNSEQVRNSTASVAAYMTFRLRDLLRSRRWELDQAMTHAWIKYQSLRGKPRWYINTESIPKAAMVGAMGKLIGSLRVYVQQNQPIRVTGTIELNEQAVLTWHNQHRSTPAKWQQLAVRKAGANPKTLGLVGSFRQIKRPFLMDFLRAGPNVDAGSTPTTSFFYRRGGGQHYANVFTAFGNRGITTRRAGSQGGTRLLNELMHALGFSAPVTNSFGGVWTVRDRLKTMHGGLIASQLRVVMQEVKIKFPEYLFVD